MRNNYFKSFSNKIGQIIPYLKKFYRQTDTQTKFLVENHCFEGPRAYK